MESSKPTVDIQVVYDPIWEACANGLQMDGSRHRILPDGDFILWMRRHYQRPSLFEYEHLETGNLVLADWIYPPSYAQELESYAPDNRPTREYFDARMVTAQAVVDRAKSNLRRMASLKKQLAEAREDTRKSAASRLRKLGMEYQALQMEMGMTPVQSEMEDPDGFGQVREDLNRLQAGRVYSHG